MKNFLLSAAFLLSMVAFMHSDVLAQTYEDIEYTLVSATDTTDSSITVTGCSDSVTDLVIPAQIDGVDVTAIDKEAFLGNKKIVTVELPSTIQKIGVNAFSECTSLTSVDLSTTSVTVLNRFFYNCTSLVSVKFPSSVTYIPYEICKNCTSLTSVNLSETQATSIGTSAFEGCTSLANITFPETLTSIGIKSFYGCTSLTKLSISSKVTTIKDGAFDNSGLKTVDCPKKSYAAKYFAYLIPGATMKFKSTAISLYIGQTKKPTVLNLPKGAVFKSSKPRIASVTKAGKITAKKAGKTVVSVSYNGYKSKCTITVKDVKLNKKVLTLATGLTYKLYLTKKLEATWKTSNSRIATVKDGQVTAKKAGVATITAVRNGIKYTCTVTVQKNEIISDSTFRVSGTSDVLLTLKKITYSGNAYKAYIHASYVGGNVSGVNNLSLTIYNSGNKILTKTVSHLDGCDYVISFSGSDVNVSSLNLTKITPSVLAKGDFLYSKLL